MPTARRTACRRHSGRIAPHIGGKIRLFSRYAHRFVENRERLSNLATTRYIPDAGLHPSTRSEAVEEPIFDEPQVLASDHSPAGQLRRSTALDPVEILLGIITFATALGEGAANDWLALMLVDNRGAPPAIGALTFAGFNVTMAIGRFTGGVVSRALRQRRGAGGRRTGLYRGGRVVFSKFDPDSTAWRSRLGAWSFLGVPFGDVSSGRSWRGFSGYSRGIDDRFGGFLVGAPLIGFLAHMMPLDRALLVVAVLVLLIAVFAPAARERGAEPAKAKDEALT